MSNWEEAHMVMEEMQGVAKRLHDLLDDPHPGLFTWSTSYHENLKLLCYLSGYSLTDNTENDND